MATIKLRLSAKADNTTKKHEILITFYHGDIYQRAKTNVFVLPDYWKTTDEDGRKINPYIEIPRFRLMTEEQKQLCAELNDANAAIKDIQQFVQQSFYDAGAGKKPLPADWLKSTIKCYLEPKLTSFADTGTNEKTPESKQKASIFDYLSEYITNKKFSESRRKHYRVLDRALKRFELYTNSNLTLDNITGDTLREFENYLTNEYTLFENGKLKKVLKAFPDSRNPQPRGQNAIADLMGKFRAFYRWANGLDKSYKLDKPHTLNNPFNHYSVGASIYGTPYYLTIEERNKLYNTKLKEPLATHRDIFIFQCFIGCRVSDLWSMTKENIIDGAIEYIPRKTKEGRPVTVRVPLSATTKEILKKYEDCKGKSLFPFTTQQQYNRSIKEMFEQAGLDRIVTVLNPTTREEEKRPLYEIASSHLARRTFVGNLYKKVQDPNLICPLSGHVEGSKAFTRYRTVDEEMKQQLIDLLE